MNGALYNLTPVTSAQQLLPPNPNRVALTVSGSGAHSSLFSFGSLQPAGFGFVATAGQNVLYFTKESLGELITQAVFWRGTALDTITVVEVFS